MSAQAQTPSSGKLLEIRALHVASGTGERSDLRSVRCHPQGRSVTLAQCLACADSGGVTVEPATRVERVSCRHERGAEWPAAPAGPAAADRTPVRSVMATEVWAVRPDVSLEALTDLFLERGIDGAPVVDEEGHPIGIVSNPDLVRARFVMGDTEEAMGPGRQVSRGHFRVEVQPGYHAEASPRASVADVMTPVAFSIPEDAAVSQAAVLMAARGVHRLPVVSADGRVAGMIGSLDVLRWLAQPGGCLRAKA